ncbi:SDR family NAD(P)-dependent oxidoreductase [Microbacterium gubbeenense]|uniref:SDR family NAD(P)-dependent oxidoreductase n=1 Tax=Microbacterium gubbeenense TaxID=159896 RepID=UPI003F98B257
MSDFPEARTAVITGGASPRGIGRATARRLARAGWSIAVVDLDAAGAADCAAELTDEFGVEAIGVGADISEEASVNAAASRIEASLAPVVALANAAGISNPTPFVELDVATWRRVLEVNATGTFLVTHRFVPGMIERGLGRIVSLSSTAAQNGGGTYSKSAYAASKAAIEGMTRALALELASEGITANAIAPATIDTDIMGGPLTEDRLPSFLSQLPVGRIGSVDEVAALIEFLVGSDAGYITGATYNINGGIRIG